MSKVETVIANTKNLLIKIVKKTARLNRNLVLDALASCGFLEPRKSTITTALMAVWKHVVAKARFHQWCSAHPPREGSGNAQLTPPEKAVVTAMKAHKDLPTDDVVETGTEVQVKKQKSTAKIDMKGAVPAAKEEPMIAEVEETMPAKNIVISTDLQKDFVMISSQGANHKLPIYAGEDGWAHYVWSGMELPLEVPSLALKGLHSLEKAVAKDVAIQTALAEAHSGAASTQPWDAIPHVSEQVVGQEDEPTIYKDDEQLEAHPEDDQLDQEYGPPAAHDEEDAQPTDVQPTVLDPSATPAFAATPPDQADTAPYSAATPEDSPATLQLALLQKIKERYPTVMQTPKQMVPATKQKVQTPKQMVHTPKQKPWSPDVVVDLLTKVKSEPQTSVKKRPASAALPLQMKPASSMKAVVVKKPAGPLKRPISRVLGKGVSQYRSMWYSNGRIAIRFKPATGQETQFASAKCSKKKVGLHVAQLAVAKLERGTLTEKDTTSFLKEQLALKE